MTEYRRVYLAHIRTKQALGLPYMKPSEFYYKVCNQYAIPRFIGGGYE